MANINAEQIKHKMRGLKIAAIGHTPQGFGFGRALDSELLAVFGVDLEAIKARELIDKAKAYTDEECDDYLEKTREHVVNLDSVPVERQRDHARLYKAYNEYTKQNNIVALASRCWPVFLPLMVLLYVLCLQCSMI